MASFLIFYEICSFVWTKVKLTVAEYYYHRFNENVIVTTKSGKVRGYKTKSPLDYEYFNFIGIPYAKPPIGELRFKEPQPFVPSSSEEIINDQFSGGTTAPQSDPIQLTAMGSEDCLHLSVYTRDIAPTTPKPVVVWIHGGAFVLGSNSKQTYNSEYLLRNDVVFIAMNYRLGAFGFVSLQDPELGVPGNAGMKDQVMALKWVKENCIHFGGDPENITLCGESAGSASVSMHLISYQSKDLFHKAVLLSGNAYAPWVISPIKDWTQRLAQKLGWNGEGGDGACLEVLQKASVREIIKAQEKIVTPEDLKQHTYLPFSPVIEPYESEHCFLNKDITELFRSAWSKDIPVIVSSCSEEGLLAYKIIMKDTNALKEAKLEYALPLQEFGLDAEDDQCHEIAERLREYYFGVEPICTKTILAYLMVLTDKLFLYPTHRLILSRIANQSAPTYLLRFSFESNFNLAKKFIVGRNVPGVCHCDDLAYYFRSFMSHSIPPKDSAEWKMIDRMCNILTTFTHTGNPNNTTLSPVQWTPIALVTNENGDVEYKCLNISNEVSFIDYPELKRMHHWEQIYKQFNKNIV